MKGIQKIRATTALFFFSLGAWILIKTQADGYYAAENLGWDILLWGSTALLIVFVSPFINRLFPRQEH